MKTPIDITQVSSLFGRISLGYVVVESRKLPEWQRFARDGLGLHADAIDGGALALRIVAMPEPDDRHLPRLQAPSAELRAGLRRLKEGRDALEAGQAEPAVRSARAAIAIEWCRSFSRRKLSSSVTPLSLSSMVSDSRASKVVWKKRSAASGSRVVIAK